MKRFSFLQAGLLAALMVAMASCAVPMGTSGDYYEDAPVRRNVYGDPYYGRANTIIVERDPYTGRYYQVAPGAYGNVHGAPAYPNSGHRYGSGQYNNNRNYNSSRSNGYYKTYPQTQQTQPLRTQPQQTPAQRQQVQQQREDAKDAIFGRKHN